MTKQYVDLTGDIPSFGTAGELRPNVSMPATPTSSDRTAAGLHEVISTMKHDRAAQELSRLATPLRDDLLMTYTVVEVVAKSEDAQVGMEQARLMAAIRSTKTSLQEGLLVFETNTFQVDESSRNTLNNAVTLNMTAANSHGGAWTDVDNVPRAMDDAKLVEFAQAVGLFYRLVHAQKLTLEAQIKAATTIRSNVVLQSSAMQRRLGRLQAVTDGQNALKASRVV